MVSVIAVFDIGKTNKKFLLLDANFGVVFINEEKFPLITDEDGFECDDIELITNWISESIDRVIKDDKYNLLGVNFSTYGASLVFLDKNGKPLTPVYNYLKEVDANISKTLYKEYGGEEEFCRKTASPPLGFLLNSGVQILWLKKEKPKIFEKVKSILHLPQYLSYSLTGKVVSEPTSIGCHTFLWDFDNMTYHPWLADKGISLPGPIMNDTVFKVSKFEKEFYVGPGIHDSSASLVPFLKISAKKFILVSTGTWCINMNPFNSEPLTTDQLAQDCLCYLTPDKQQVKSSRLFMGHFHEVWIEKLNSHFETCSDYYKTISLDKKLLDVVTKKYPNSVYFPDGKESFNEGLNSVKLNGFSSYDEAYTKLMFDLTALCGEAIQLIIPEHDDTEILYVSGGFAKNPIFVYLMKSEFPGKKILTIDIDNSSGLGAAMVIEDICQKSNVSNYNFGISE